MIATLSSGHVDLSDWLLLIAFIVFVVEAVLIYTGTAIARIALSRIGLALLALAWFVL